jgi:hypothetical protein
VLDKFLERTVAGGFRRTPRPLANGLIQLDGRLGEHLYKSLGKLKRPLKHTKSIMATDQH